MGFAMLARLVSNPWPQLICLPRPPKVPGLQEQFNIPMMNVGPILEHRCNSILVGLKVHISFSSGLPTGAVFHIHHKSNVNYIQPRKEVYNVFLVATIRKSSQTNHTIIYHRRRFHLQALH
ncbi:hypothetical protein AAY473_021221 [Plecturocebus cupreus]